MTTTEQNTLEFREAGWREHPVSGSELAKSMLLLRASNMNVMRLQLAMERRDRRLAMEALDGLVALDSEIRGLIAHMPAADDALGAMARRIDDQRAVLASEKLIFAAGKTGPAIAPRADITAPPSAVTEPSNGISLNQPTEATATVVEPEFMLSADDIVEEEAPPKRRFVLIAVALLLLAIGAAVALYLLGVEGLPTIDSLSRLARSL